MSEQELPSFEWTPGLDDVPAEQARCIPAWEEHDGYHDTGERGVVELTGAETQIWRCQCGAKTLEPVTHLLEKREQDDRDREMRAREN